jgi:hypothetical protein
MHEIYDLWVGSAEGVYAQAARGRPCGRRNDERVEPAAQRAAGTPWRVTKQFDLPTRAELNSIHQQLREPSGGARRQAELTHAGTRRAIDTLCRR